MPPEKTEVSTMSITKEFENTYHNWVGIEKAIARIEEAEMGAEMLDLMARLFPICRSITGDGVRQTLAGLSHRIDLNVQEVPTGYRAFDWIVPKEWNINDAYVKNEKGERIIDFQKSNLHVLGYSTPMSGIKTRDELIPHLYTKPEQPDAIPYLTSYYEERWGFCLSEEHLQTLPDGPYEVLIDSNLKDGQLTFGDSVLPGCSNEEILFSTYMCHPSMCNDNLSGPVLSSFIYEVLSQWNLNYTYRFVFVPETIGALVYLSQNGEHLRQHLKAGYVLTCVGDAGPFTYKRSKRGDTDADKVAEHCLRHIGLGSKAEILDFFPTGSDERQYCSPGFDLPVGSLVRSMYGNYPEYHTSLDDLNFVSADGMAGSFEQCLRVVQTHEINKVYLNLSPNGEPQLGRRGLYSTTGAKTDTADSSGRLRMMYLLAYCDGARDLVDIASMTEWPAWEFVPEIKALMEAGLLSTIESVDG